LDEGGTASLYNYRQLLVLQQRWGAEVSIDSVLSQKIPAYREFLQSPELPR